METLVLIIFFVVIILIGIQGEMDWKNHSKWKVKAEEICKSSIGCYLVLLWL